MWNDGEATVTPQSHQIKFKRVSKLAQAVMIIKTLTSNIGWDTKC